MSNAELPYPLPEDPLLAEAARALEVNDQTGEIIDAGWRLRYVSSELRQMTGVYEDESLGYGRHALARPIILPEVWRSTPESMLGWWRKEAPFALADRGLAGDPDPDFERMIGEAHNVEAAEPPPAWALKFETTLPDGSPITVSRLGVRLRRQDGTLAGMLFVYVGGGLRASVQTRLTRGDRGMFERMLRLVEPARRPAAILFADIAGSGPLARRLSTRAYFELIRTMTSQIDRAVIAEQGIIGKHVGDGITAFFLAEQIGGEAAAAQAAIAAAGRIVAAVESIDAHGAEVAVRVGLHWGATLMIGQITTDGRLEVTALGDEVNEGARVEESAPPGQIMATKELLERLAPEAAADLGVDLDAIAYEILGELDHVSEKARRDAGGLAVTTLPGPR